MINTPYQFKSLASRVRGMHGALDAAELAKLLGVAKVTILRRAKRGKIPSFRIGTMVRFDPAARTRCPVSIHSEEGYGTLAGGTMWKESDPLLPLPATCVIPASPPRGSAAT